MQTPAEKYLISRLADHIKAGDSKDYKILNIGAGKSLAIEMQLVEAGCAFISERVDVEHCAVDFPAVKKYWVCSVEDMKPVGSGDYQAAFANYVLEHVENLTDSIREIHRVLAPAGVFIAAIPNPSALEFIVSKNTPLWFHQWVRGGHGWETTYAYKNIPALLDLFRQGGFEIVESKCWPCVEQYVYNKPVLNLFGKLYDRFILFLNARRLMGNVCIVVRKP